jgi:CRISPR/Cas system CMR-associated protein Cmr5 small subunit
VENFYHFLHVPFGVTNGVACFQRVSDNIVQDEGLEGVFPNLDGVTICGKHQLEHDHNLEKFLAAPEKYNLTLNEEKYTFSNTSVNLLGYTIENKTMKPDLDHLKLVLELPIPKDTTLLQRALGMFDHYYQWIPTFSEKLHPVLFKKHFHLSEEAMSACISLKNDVAKATITGIEDNITFRAETDASDFAISATLSQAGGCIAFFSRMLNKAEQNYSSIEKKAYAIVETLFHWRHYLIGQYFYIFTDQRSLSFMFDQHHASEVKNEKIMRWRLELAYFKFDIIYHPGNRNATADTLSRITAAISSGVNLTSLHYALCHPGIAQMSHSVCTKNLPFSIDDIRKVTNSCCVCNELKPQFVKNEGN